MNPRIYISNISPLWPRSRQVELLKEAIPGFPKTAHVFEDNLDARSRRAHQIDSLVGRAAILRPTRRGHGTEVIIASLAVFAWSQGEMLQCLTAAAARGDTIRVLDAGISIGPSAGPAILQQALAAFEAARARQKEFEQGRSGATVSAHKREAKSREAAEGIRAAWARRDEKTADLLTRADISLNTAKRYLGSRPVAQKAQDAANRRKAKRRPAK